jgi:hypothetical protein
MPEIACDGLPRSFKVDDREAAGLVAGCQPVGSLRRRVEAIKLISRLPVAYTNLEGREGLLEALAESTEQIGASLEFLSAAHGRLDDQSAERLEERLFGAAQRAYATARKAYSGFAARHGLTTRGFDQPSEPPASLKSAELIEKAAAEAEGADEMLSGLQDDQALIEVGDVELRSGVADVRQAIGVVPGRAREMLRTLGR